MLQASRQIGSAPQHDAAATVLHCGDGVFSAALACSDLSRTAKLSLLDKLFKIFKANSFFVLTSILTLPV